MSLELLFLVFFLYVEKRGARQALEDATMADDSTDRKTQFFIASALKDSGWTPDTVLNKGDFAILVSVHRPRLGETADKEWGACKISTDHPEALQMLRHERVMLTNCSQDRNNPTKHHRNVVAILEPSGPPTKRYFVCELALYDLFSRLQVNKGLEGGDQATKAVLEDVANALQHIHDLHYVHMDVKPENVLIFADADRQVAKLCDFGFTVHTRKFSRLRRGTPFYLAPELLSTEKVDDDCNHPAHDMWSLGVVMFLCTFGLYPFTRAHNDDERFQNLKQHGVAQVFKDYPCWDSEDRSPAVLQWLNLLDHLLQANLENRLTAKGTLDALKHPHSLQARRDRCSGIGYTAAYTGESARATRPDGASYPGATVPPDAGPISIHQLEDIIREYQATPNPPKRRRHS